MRQREKERIVRAERDRLYPYICIMCKYSVPVTPDGFHVVTVEEDGKPLPTTGLAIRCDAHEIRNLPI